MIVGWDKMVRARQQRRYAHFSPTAIRSLLKVGGVKLQGD
jgi:hypothetical protein